jgi:hypothetical protein
MLSIRQPWLYAIMYLDKYVENRTWLPPKRIIGKQIALHASTYREQRYLEESLDVIETIVDIDREKVKQELRGTYGKVLALAHVTGAFAFCLDQITVVYGNPDTQKHTNSKYREGPACWCLDNVERLKHTLKVKGKLGLLSLSNEAESYLLQQEKQIP